MSHKIISDIKALPDLKANDSKLTLFASKLKNAVAAASQLNFMGFLNGPELIQSIGSKLSSSLNFAYNKYPCDYSDSVMDLEELANFLYAKTKLAVAR